jgi:hypothetical protein
MDRKDLANRFTYHPPRGPGQAGKYEDIRNGALQISIMIDNLCPDSREKSLAITHIEEMVFWANASIARNEKKLEDAAKALAEGFEKPKGG